MSDSLNDATHKLNRSGLISPSELASFLETQSNSPTTSDELMALLTDAERLTPFQAEAVLQGGQRLVLGNYVLLDRIGAGGMGEVYLAEHQRMKRKVALKVISPEFTQDELALKRFEREVRAVARLSHPNIVTAHDADESHDVHFFVMEYVQGEDLASHVKRHDPVAPADALNILRQTAEGMAYAHAQGLIHRDLKPANLLRDRSGVVKILDLGLARFEKPETIIDQPTAASSDDFTSSGMVMGTVDYMAPEQAYDTKSADARSDIYSLGCTFYFLLTGQCMYAGENAVQKIIAHRDNPIPPLAAKRNDLPGSFEGIYQRMVAKRPDDRFQTMQELVNALVFPSMASQTASTDAVTLQEFSSDEIPRELAPTTILPIDEEQTETATSSKIKRWINSPPRVWESLLVGTAVLALAIWTSKRVGSEKQNENQSQEETTEQSDPKQEEWIDLLTRIELNKDVPRDAGAWEFVDDGLQSPQQEFARVSSPLLLPDRYKLRAEFTRTAGNDGIGFFLKIATRQVMFVVDGWGGIGLSGLQAVNRKNKPDTPEEGVAGFQLQNGQRYRIEFTISFQGEEAVIETVLTTQETEAFRHRWQGAISSLQLIDKRLTLGDTRRPGFSVWDSKAILHQFEVQLLEGEPEWDRPPKR